MRNRVATKAPTRRATTPLRVARVYLRVSTEEQDLERQAGIAQQAKDAGYYVAAVYQEKASGARPDRPELLRMINDLQIGEVVIAENIDRISRLPLEKAEELIAAIRAKGARLAIPGVIDLAELSAGAEGVSKIVLNALQEMLLKVALQIANDDYEMRRKRQRQGIEIARAANKYSGRKPNTAQHRAIRALRKAGHSITETAQLAHCSVSQVKRIMALRGPQKQR